jgi:peptidyl-tRNA hydrolase, PTH1 family
MALKIITGLGNPGQRYLWTRHNAGFMVLDRLSELAGIRFNRHNFSALEADGFWNGERLILLKPQTFMNISGRSVAEAVRFYKIPLDSLVVVHDEIDLPFGTVRLKKGGGHGGHNGLRSIISDLGCKDFIRLRVGIGGVDLRNTTDYVLSNFNKKEIEDLLFVLDGALDMLAGLMTNGIEKTMSLFNCRNFISSEQEPVKQ